MQTTSKVTRKHTRSDALHSRPYASFLFTKETPQNIEATHQCFDKFTVQQAQKAPPRPVIHLTPISPFILRYEKEQN